MPDLLKRINAAINAHKRERYFFDKGESLMILVPEQEHHRALLDINNYLHLAGTRTYPFVGSNDERERISPVSLQIMGVTCHIIRADVSQVVFSISHPLKYPELAETTNA